ncbi:MAG: hypothetical protein CML16_18150 [Pusillimonas sp.]|nr:hypothetical protein [Pusillimonas sp.]
MRICTSVSERQGPILHNLALLWTIKWNFQNIFMLIEIQNKVKMSPNKMKTYHIRMKITSFIFSITIFDLQVFNI